jgi:phosphate transport system ATP-binding protein
VVTDGMGESGIRRGLGPTPRNGDIRDTLKDEQPMQQQASKADEALASPQHLVGETADDKDDRSEILSRPVMFDIDDVVVSYGGTPAVRDIRFQVYDKTITAFIGPSGCGKSTLIRCLNRTNDLIAGASVEGTILYHGQDLYAPKVDAVEVRKRIGMVFQKPNPFPKSIYDNIAFGPRVIGMKGDMDEIVERALTRAALWDEVKDRLKTNAFGMSGGQQQRLCIARALATQPDVLLMDEPCSALDPISTGRIEDLMLDLKQQVSIVIVTHNMQQAARVSDMTAFFTVELDAGETHRTGRMVEYDHTEKIFTNPGDPRTEAYVTGKVG